MRILKEFDRSDVKITIFGWNGKISVKFEKDLVEVIYKFRDGSGIENTEAAESFLNETFLETVKVQLSQLSAMRFQRWQEWHTNDNFIQEIEKII